MSNNVTRLEELFVELGPEGLMKDSEARMLIETDPECSAVYEALGEVAALVSQLPTPKAPNIVSDFAPVKARVELENRPATTASDMEWYVAEEDEQVGPLDTDQVRKLIRESLIASECLAWRTGMGDWRPIAEIDEFSSLLLGQKTNNQPIQGVQTRMEEHPQSSVPLAHIEWKPTAAEQLSSLVKDEIDKEDEKKEPKQESTTNGTPEPTAVATPSVDFFAPESGRISWSPPTPTESPRLRSLHLILGGVGSSFATAATILLVLQLYSKDMPQPASATTQPPDRPIGAMPAPAARSEAPAGASALPAPAPRPVGPKASAGRPPRASAPRAAQKKARTDDVFDEPPPGKAAKARLSVEDILRGVTQNSRTVTSCLRTARSKGELLPGRYRLILDWTIEPDGSVTEGRIIGPGFILGTSLPTCFAKKMKKWRFPASSAGAPVRNFLFGPFIVK